MNSRLRSLSAYLATLVIVGCSSEPDDTSRSGGGANGGNGGSQPGGSAGTSSSGGIAGTSGSAGENQGGGGLGGTAGTGATAGTGGTGGTGGIPGTTTLSVQAGPWTISPGEEAVKCVVVELGNDEPVVVRRFRTTLNEGSHHMIVYKSDGPADPTPFACQSFGVAGGSAIFIAQQAHSELIFPTTPEGAPVGLEMVAHQALTLEIHYINPTAAPLDVEGTVELDVLPASAEVVPSSFAFLGAFSIPTIAPHSDADTGVLFQSMPSDSHVFALTTHQHQLGTRMRVWYASDVNDLSTQIADSTSWSDPPLVTFDPALPFLGTSKGMAYQCHWQNPTNTAVNGGLSANDEMCFFWAYYY